MLDEMCRNMGISAATFYMWRQKYDVQGHSNLRKLERLEEENSKRKDFVAELSLDKAMKQEGL